MASYAALVSLSHILQQILHPPPLSKIIIDRQQIEFLQGKVSFLIDFLETYYETYSSRRSQEIADLETQIADAAYAAEDIIESNVVEQILGTNGEKITTLLCERIETVLEKFNSIKKEVVKMREMQGMRDLQPRGLATTTSSSPLPSGNDTIMVGFDEHMNEIMGALTTDESKRQIISIVGMGGIGKTTLAKNIYNEPYIEEYFYIRAWVTISQEYNARQILLCFLHQITNKNLNDPEISDYQLGDLLYKELFGSRYLIVMDDMWDIQAWDNIKMFLPPNNNRSRILVTTRLSYLAVDFGSCSPHQIGLLDEEKSWDLLHEKVFGKEDCPIELEEIGKDIAKKCRGLPLAIVVIGGLLAKSKRTKEYWESIKEDVTLAINYDNDEHFMKILLLSYSHLPIYLKPCFLYFSVFPEDYSIHVSRLIRLWVAEGFIKPSKFKSLEEVAKEFLEDLIDRNLILVSERGRRGKVKRCNIHDLMRELCRREAKKGKFLCVIPNVDDPNISPILESERRLSIHYLIDQAEELRGTLRPATLNRSLLNYSHENLSSICDKFSLLRILDEFEDYSSHKILELINLRYYAFLLKTDGHFHSVSSSLCLLWNLQTLVVDSRTDLPAKIWEMPQLRHLKMSEITLSDPPDSQHIIVVLENLQTLSMVKNLTITDQVVERTPNLKKLGIYYDRCNDIGSFCLSNVVRLHKLESLYLDVDFTGNWGNITFPSSLRKLTLQYCLIPWENLSMVGKLPNLEVLKLGKYGAKGLEWNPIEGEFCKLKVLLIRACEDLQAWGANNTHFPSLEHLSLYQSELMDIPKDFAEIPTLQVINMELCSSLLLTSAKEISEERENLGYEALQVRSRFPLKFPTEDDIVDLEKDATSMINFLNEESDRFQVIWIIPKISNWRSTLAWKVYRDPEIRNEFPTLIWVYIYEESKTRDVFLTILKKFTEQDMSSKTGSELAKIVRSYLEKHKFLLFFVVARNIKVWKSIEASLSKSDGFGKFVITTYDDVKQAKYRRELNTSTLYYSRHWIAEIKATMQNILPPSLRRPPWPDSSG